MATLIYTEQAGDKLKLLAEVGEDNMELAVDALLDAEPKFEKDQPFVCFPSEARVVIEAEAEVVQPRRRMKLNGKFGGGEKAAPKRPTRARKPVAQADEGEVETKPKPATKAPAKKAPAKPAAAKKPAAKAAAKPAAKKPAAKPAAKKAAGKASPFKRNAKSDE